MESKELTAEVYALDALAGANDNGWLWDFGVFTCRGTAEYPYRSVTNMEASSAWANTVDVTTLREQEPERTETVTVYEYDFDVYAEVPLDAADYLFTDDGQLAELNSVAEARFGQEDEDTEYIALSTYVPGRPSDNLLLTATELEDAVEDGTFKPVTSLTP